MSDIRLENITKIYASGGEGTKAVDDISLSIASGEFFFLLGPSGCGKTTLLRMIAGLSTPSAGRVLIGGRDVTAEPVEKRSTAMVFQNYALWPHMTVAQNVQFGPKMRGLPRDQRRKIAEDSLRMVEMESFLRRKPNQLSGGQQQRVALARALAAQGQCLLLDEPLSNLDARLRLHMRSELRGLVKQSGITAVYVTHDQKEALSMADRIAVMNAGKIVQVGTPQELYNHPATVFVADFLGEANFAVGTVASSASGRCEVQTPIGKIIASGAAEAGAKVTCCIRPERVEMIFCQPSNVGFGGTPKRSEAQLGGAVANTPKFVPTGQNAIGGDTENSIILATIKSSTYLGEAVQYVCDLADGKTWRVSVPAGKSNPLSPGQKVNLRVNADDVSILTE